MNINILDKKDCCGCSACKNICPQGAISFEENKEGFLEPKINENCTNCALCTKICPILNTKYKNKSKPACFALMANDEIRLKSSSGGVFYPLAKYFIENNGYVAGVVWKSSNNFSLGAKTIVSNRIEDIKAMQKSKYIQSDPGDCYKQVKALLEENKKVLFTGTPCQIAGLKGFLIKDYKNLFCADLICHGVPSPKVFKKYIEENFDISKMKYYDFRPKEKIGWGCGICADLENEVKIIKSREDDYYRAFLNNLILRNSCHTCKFNTIPRQGDITMGDFWGIEEKYNDNLGTSLLLINNSKGKDLLKFIKKELKLYKKMPLKSAVKRNSNIIKPSISHQNREEFFAQFDKMTLRQNIKQLLDDKVN